MQTLWDLSWWWCLVPLLFMALLAMGCVAFMGRHGGCRCAPGSACGRKEG
jgi:hypothetical protein